MSEKQQGEFKKRIRESQEQYHSILNQRFLTWVDEANADFPITTPINATSGILQISIVDWNNFVGTFNAWQKKWLGQLLSLPKEPETCEHDWQPITVNFQQVDRVCCVKCSVSEDRFVYVCPACGSEKPYGRIKNQRFPWTKYPGLKFTNEP
jgi:hypothetical protein